MSEERRDKVRVKEKDREGRRAMTDRQEQEQNSRKRGKEDDRGREEIQILHFTAEPSPTSAWNILRNFAKHDEAHRNLTALASFHSLLFGPPPRLALEQGSIQPSPPVNTSPAQQLWPSHLSAHTVPFWSSRAPTQPKKPVPVRPHLDSYPARRKG
ncbi:unnamed protein product [Pleuronectes platessa]|uniref:Uncharacterized protein n=1 Tax=Pleuronectes platessa TaxID=8262 RepID=A0A9N7TN83_PLEPL|nr:unnamed protein product [Pleuronectes platessa]